jgi:hypothetical protein
MDTNEMVHAGLSGGLDFLSLLTTLHQLFFLPLDHQRFSSSLHQPTIFNPQTHQFSLPFQTMSFEK